MDPLIFFSFSRHNVTSYFGAFIIVIIFSFILQLLHAAYHIEIKNTQSLKMVNKKLHKA